MMDALANGRRIKCLTVVDDFSRGCVDIAVDYGIGGEYVTRVLDRVGQFRGYPKAIRTDQGPEFTSRAFMAWAHAGGIKHLITDAGKPTQNAYVESFNGKFSDECLNERRFDSLWQAAGRRSPVGDAITTRCDLTARSASAQAICSSAHCSSSSLLPPLLEAIRSTGPLVLMCPDRPDSPRKRHHSPDVAKRILCQD